MIEQDKKKVGFVVPQPDNQRNQGGAVSPTQSTGGGTGNANNAGNTGVIKSTKKMGDTRQQAATEDPISLSKPLEQGASAIYNLPKTIGSGIISAAKGVGEGLLAGGVGLANAISSDGSMRSTSKYNVEDVRNKIGSIVDSALTPSNYSNVIKNATDRLGVSTPSLPSFNITPTATQQPVVQQSTQEPIKTELGVTTPSQPAAVTPQPIVENSNESKYYLNPQNYAVSNSPKANIGYSKNEDGSVSRIDLSTGSRSTLGNISSIGPNGTNADGSPLSAKDQAALDRSNKMVADWNEKKERASLVANAQRLTNDPRAYASQRREAQDMLQAYDANKTTRLGNELTAQSQYDKARLENNKQLFERDRDTVEAFRKANKDSFDNDLNTQKLIQEDQKNMVDPVASLSKLQTLGKLNSASARAVLGDKLKGLNTKQEVEARLGELEVPSVLASEILIDYPG